MRGNPRVSARVEDLPWPEVSAAAWRFIALLAVLVSLARLD
jgi:hypothetical protein